MRFIDEVVITIISGNGGNGHSSFRREKYYPLGGPDGGDGGDGGCIYFQADNGLNTLATFRSKRVFKAEHGEDGRNSQMHGKYAEDLILKVPVGTIVRSTDVETGSGQVLADLTEHGQRILMAEGGRGGMGNIHFKSSVQQAPKTCTPGKEGQTIELDLELKLIADIALIGLPNAGKSTMISSISAARPKIADYPFTTLEPNLGVVDMGDECSFVVADIPGLIEDASEGKGLGVKFLKHIERTKAFVHLIDVSWCLNEFEAFEQYVTIREELRKFNEELLNKKELVCLTKIDAMTDEEIDKYVNFFEEQIDRKVLPVSSVSGRNISLLKSLMLKTFEDYKE
ncbi:GTPase ObgE [Halobacteriovorax marinus]|uniref:GTPase Obg n=1 Tax=Halobacteriovorax marinus TaxID=97084 RepID=A0A1Y5FAZ4_9BACT|nr:GTPase ObgE [Halobacteriovorax marinus]